jgi:hypothetical protein
MIQLPPDFIMADYIAELLTFVALFIPVLAAFFGYGIVKRILRRG